MIFDSTAHQLAEEDLNFYLGKTFDALTKEFPNKVGYYAKDGINYETIIEKQNNPEISLAGLGVDSNIDLRDYFTKTSSGFVQGNFSEHFLTLPHEDFLPELDVFITFFKRFLSGEALPAWEPELPDSKLWAWKDL